MKKIMLILAVVLFCIAEVSFAETSASFLTEKELFGGNAQPELRFLLKAPTSLEVEGIRTTALLSLGKNLFLGYREGGAENEFYLPDGREGKFSQAEVFAGVRLTPVENLRLTGKIAYGKVAYAVHAYGPWWYRPRETEYKTFSLGLERETFSLGFNKCWSEKGVLYSSVQAGASREVSLFGQPVELTGQVSHCWGNQETATILNGKVAVPVRLGAGFNLTPSVAVYCPMGFAAGFGIERKF